ncbi:MAG: G-D-S-L family lipolytic protein [Planctomycetes bacterium]|nr:G-D-S-L family lipolytic protein [Planctomycetota bacterium]
MRATWLMTAVLMGLTALAGCTGMSGPKSAGRTDEQKRQLVKPGLFGNNAPADRLRGRFDFWNEEVIRQDVAVGTVFLGDSITELWELSAYFAPADGIILNRGIGGDISTDMVRRFDADVIQLRPRNAVILAGTNDVARMLASKSEEEIVSTVTEAIETMMDAARKAGINVLVCSILPTNDDTKNHEGKARVLPRINGKLKAACVARACVYVDCWSRLIDSTGVLDGNLARDGLHPHYAGYEIMARCLIEAAGARGLRL